MLQKNYFLRTENIVKYNLSTVCTTFVNKIFLNNKKIIFIVNFLGLVTLKRVYISKNMVN